MPATITGMPKPKQPADRHKPRRLVGIPERICAALERMGEERETSLTEMVKAACIHFLTEQGRWPPKPPAR